MHKINQHQTKAQKRKLRTRGKLVANADRPRLNLYRSNKYLYLQILDSITGKVLCSSNELSLRKAKVKVVGTKTERAKLIATDLLEKLNKLKISKLQFDRGAYKYHGRIKQVAEVLRTGGIEV